MIALTPSELARLNELRRVLCCAPSEALGLHEAEAWLAALPEASRNLVLEKVRG